MFKRREDSALKIRFKQAEGKEVREDLFLFSCYETERTRFALDGTFPGDDIRYPILAGANPENVPASFANKTLPDILTDVLAWYRDNRSEMAQESAFDHQLMNDVVAHLVALKHDLDLATRLKTGAPVPVYERATTETFWEIVERRLRQLFPAQCHIYMRYLQWCYAEDMAEVFEPGSRPPVGKYAPPMRRADRGPKGDRGGRDRDRGGRDRDRGGRDRDRGGDRPPQPQQQREGKDEDFGNRKDYNGGGRRDRGRDRGRDRDRDRGRDRDRDRHRGGGGGNQQRNPELEEASLADVASGLSVLSKQPEMPEFALRPTNSFYRRLQHQQIARAGLYSYSQGEDPERCVVITRDPNSAE